MRRLVQLSDNGTLWGAAALAYGVGMTVHIFGGPAPLKAVLFGIGAVALTVDLLLTFVIREEER